MSRWRDIVDWVGGYPYEVARPEEVFDFYRPKGFELTKLKCGGVGMGCNEYVFVKNSRESAVPPDEARGSDGIGMGTTASGD